MSITQFATNTLFTGLWYAVVLNATSLIITTGVFTAPFLLTAAALHMLLYTGAAMAIGALDKAIK